MKYQSVRRLLLITMISAVVSQADPQSPQVDQRSTAARLRSLNNEVLRLHGELQTVLSDGQQAGRKEGALLIEQRAAALRTLMRQDPQQALSLSFSPEVLANLAATFPESASRLETHGRWQGLVEHWVLDNRDGTHQSVHLMKVGDETLEIAFTGPEPPDPHGGMALAEGVRVGSAIAVSTITWMPSSTSATNGAAMTTSGSTAQSCSTTGVQNVAVILVNYPSVTPPSYLTPQNVYSSFFGTTGRSLDGYWREASYGKTFATGNVFGWYTLSSSSYPSMNALRDEAIALAASNAGVNFQNYTRLFIIMPDYGGGWAGLANMVCETVNSPTGSFSASTSYVNGTNWMYNNDDATRIVMHEGGHNLGLNHASSRAFGAEALGPLGTAGTIVEYGDEFSAMTDSGWGHYSAPHVAQLNWFTNANYQVVQSSGTWTLKPLETPSSGLQALKIQRGTGNNAWLWIEYRQPVGNYDIAYVNDYPQWYPWANQVFSGALVHYEDPLTTNAYAHLLDFTPTSESGFYDPALASGQTWSDPYTNLSITVLAANASGLTVSVSYGAAPCTHANPTVSLSPPNPSAAAGASANYTVSVLNNDAAACASSLFNFSSSLPSASWPTTFSATSLAINPGQTGSVTMIKTVPAGTAPGTNPVNATAASGTFLGSNTANLTVVAPASLSVSLSMTGTAFSARQTASLTATVLNNGSPQIRVPVTFTMTDASGAKSTYTATTDKTGKAVWAYRVGAKDPKGSYSVVAAATSGSQTATSNSVSFAVQ